MEQMGKLELLKVAYVNNIVIHNSSEVQNSDDTGTHKGGEVRKYPAH
jgi:hypothetical protein